MKVRIAGKKMAAACFKDRAVEPRKSAMAEIDVSKEVERAKRYADATKDNFWSRVASAASRLKGSEGGRAIAGPCPRDKCLELSCASGYLISGK